MITRKMGISDINPVSWLFLCPPHLYSDSDEWGSSNAPKVFA